MSNSIGPGEFQLRFNGPVNNISSHVESSPKERERKTDRQTDKDREKKNGIEEKTLWFKTNQNVYRQMNRNT